MYKEFDEISSKLFTESRFFRSSVNALPSNVLVEKKPAVLLFKDGTHYVFDGNEGSCKRTTTANNNLQEGVWLSGLTANDGRSYRKSRR